MTIKDAALALALERPVDSITLAELVRMANVSRQGFYEHFRNRDEAVLAAIADDLRDWLEEVDGVVHRDAPTIVRQLTAFIDARRPLYANLRDSTLFGAAVDVWRQLLTPVCRELASKLIDTRRESLDDSDISALTDFILGGMIEMIRTWLRAESPAAADREAALMWRQIRRFLDVGETVR